MMRSPIDGLWLPLAYINGGGMCIRWFRDNFTGTPRLSYDELEAEARNIQPGSEGLIFSPHFSGRILPSAPSLKGGFVGLDYKHGRGHLYRSVLESIAYEYACYLSVLRANYPNDRFEEMITIGGGANSPLFCRIKADVLGLRVHTFEMRETALLASALIAGMGVGLFRDYKAPIHAVMRRSATCEPDAKRHADYAAYAQKYLEVLNATEPLFQSGIYSTH
jgi:xylulokinase